MILARIIRQHFGNNKHISIKVNPNSELKKYLRKSKTQAELSWQRKMRAEWVYIFFIAFGVFNFSYIALPQYRLTHNLFMNTEASMFVEAK